MKTISFTLRALGFLAFTLAFASATQAQATRTWVSGVGDDANPCSRTAPCKTYAGAISKTAAAGEISTLDPGGFGAVVITKSLTIDGTQGQGYGSILASLTNGVVVNDSGTATPNTILVTLRNLSINGAGNGTNGIRYVSGKSLHVENCVIANFRGGTGRGIDVALTVAAGQLLTVKDTIIHDNSGEGIRLANTAAGGAINMYMDNTRIDRCNIGLVVAAVSVANVRNSVFGFNTAANVRVENAGSNATIENSYLVGSPGSGIITTAGNVRLRGSHVTNNATGLNCSGGTVSSYGDNALEGNGANTCAFPLPSLPKR